MWIISCQVDNLLVNMVKLGRKGFNITRTSFRSYENRPLPGSFFNAERDSSCQWQSVHRTLSISYLHFAVPE